MSTPVLSAFDCYTETVLTNNYEAAEAHARAIAQLPAQTIPCIIAKITVLKDLLRPETWCEDEPERTILMGLADELRGLKK